MSLTDLAEMFATGADDPYPQWNALRDEAPVHTLGDGGMHLVTRYDDVYECLRDHKTFSSETFSMGPEGVRLIISTDPPDHTKLRQLVTGPFRPAAIAAMEPRVRAIGEQLVDELVAANRNGVADLIPIIGEALPVIVIAEMLGIPIDRRDAFRLWSDASLGGMSGGTVNGMTSEEAMAHMGAFFAEVARERRKSPGDDLVSKLVTGAEPLTEEELLYFCFTLLVAGNETTTNLIGNATMALFANPGEAERLWADPSLVPSAMEEALRYDPPAQMVIRRATHDTTVAGHDIPAESMVFLMLAAANRDPRHYDEPQRFDVGRNPRDHLGFGNGIHLCLGAALARLESRVVFETLIERVGDLRPNGDAERNGNQMLRGLKHLPVTFDERS